MSDNQNVGEGTGNGQGENSVNVPNYPHFLFSIRTKDDKNIQCKVFTKYDYLAPNLAKIYATEDGECAEENPHNIEYAIPVSCMKPVKIRSDKYGIHYIDKYGMVGVLDVRGNYGDNKFKKRMGFKIKYNKSYLGNWSNSAFVSIDYTTYDPKLRECIYFSFASNQITLNAGSYDLPEEEHALPKIKQFTIIHTHNNNNEQPVCAISLNPGIHNVSEYFEGLIYNSNRSHEGCNNGHKISTDLSSVIKYIFHTSTIPFVSSQLNIPERIRADENILLPIFLTSSRDGTIDVAMIEQGPDALPERGRISQINIQIRFRYLLKIELTEKVRISERTLTWRKVSNDDEDLSVMIVGDTAGAIHLRCWDAQFTKQRTQDTPLYPDNAEEHRYGPVVAILNVEKQDYTGTLGEGNLIHVIWRDQRQLTYRIVPDTAHIVRLDQLDSTVYPPSALSVIW